jgi:flagellar biogenesis protein FliO
MNVGQTRLLPPRPVCRERAGVRVISNASASGARNHDHPNFLPDYRDRGQQSQWYAICRTIFLAVIFFGTAAQGQATRPFDDEPLKSGSSPVKFATSADGTNASQLTNSMGTVRVVIALAIVLVAIFLLRWLARQFVRTGLQSGTPIKLLSRSVLSAKQQVLLLQVGKRLIVVGDSGGSMNALCEINDPDEVAGLVGQSQQDRPVIQSFAKFFGRAKETFVEDVPAPTVEAEEAAPNPEIVEMSRDIGGLMEKVQLMRRQFKT